MATEQLGLVELAPPHGLALRDAVWGIDVSTQRVALGMLDFRTPGEVNIDAATCSLAQPSTEGARLVAARGALLEFFESAPLAGIFTGPSLVVVEMPFATQHRVHAASYFMVGVVLQALWECLGLSCEIMLLNPSEWKKYAMGAGHGFARKHAILAWARSIGFAGTCSSCLDGLAPRKSVGKGRRAGLDCGSPSHHHDEADAVAMATAGAVLLAKRRG